jgi:uncharacterized protein involved in exopolysaccharide biosynthesis
MDLLYFLRVLYRKKWIIIGLSLLAVVASFLVLINKKPMYESVAQYSTGFTTEKIRLIDGSAAIDLYTADVKFNNAIETFKSPRVISMISYKLLLHDLEDPSRAYRRLSQKAMQSPVYKQIDQKIAREILIEKINKGELLRSDNDIEARLLELLKLYGYDYNGMLDNMTIERVGRTDYLNITFRSENRDLSALVVNSMGQEFLNYYRSLTSQRTEENAQSIKGMVETQQKKVDSLVKNLLNEKVSQGTIDPVSRTASAMETVKELESKLADARGKYNEHFNRITYLKQRLNTLQNASSSVGSPDEVVKLTNKKNALVAELARKGGKDADLEQQINDLRTEIILKSGSTSGKKVKEEIDDLNRQISEEEALLNAANSSITDYTASIRRYMGMTNINPGSTIKIDAIKTQLEMENKQLGSVKEKYTQAEGLLRDDPTSNFIQTRIGQPAIEPESKKTLITMALSGVSMFLLSAVFFIFLEIFDSTVKTPVIFARQAKAHIAAVINHINIKKKPVVEVIVGEEGTGRSALPYKIFKNNIRKLRFEIMDSGKRSFLISSTQRGTGKSTIIEALAASMVLSKKKVLIIDLNFSHNSLTQYYNADVFIQDIAERIHYNEPALAHKLYGNTPLEGLHIIGCHETNNSPAEALYNIDMFALLHLLAQEFDFILIEGAALNDYADSKELAQYVDAVFTVFNADAPFGHADEESLHAVARLREKNLGTILNNVLTENINS